MIKKAIKFLRSLQDLSVKIDYLQQSVGRIESRQLRDALIKECEFKVYSQSGEDGIIQYLINNITIKHKTFIEFGVENYLEANTRFLTLNDYWAGLIIDGDSNNIDFIKKDPIYWRCNLKAECTFITRENINQVFTRNGLTGEIGLLSIDIDGNDYWVWEAIDTVNPAIVIAEYNSFFGPNRNVSVPYNPSFVRTQAHFSKIYYGASISALTSLANRKGYKLVASNKSGNNVFYVREDLMGDLKEISCIEAYKPISFREAHDENGQLLYTSFEEAKKLILDLKVYDLDKQEEVIIRDL